MRCEYCKIEINGDVGICPLCHEVLSDERGSDTGFPVPDNSKKKPKTRTRLGLWYLFSVSVVVAVCLFVNVSVKTDTLYHWWIIVAGALYYGVFLIKNTIFSYLSAGQKVFWQLIYVLGFMYGVEFVFASLISPFVADYGLPVVCFIAVTTIFIYTLIAKKYMRQNVVSVIMLSALGFLPLILYYAGASEVIWAALVSASASIVATLFTIIFSRKHLASEFQRKFHI